MLIVPVLDEYCHPKVAPKDLLMVNMSFDWVRMRIVYLH